MKDWIVETRVVSRRVYFVQADDEREAIFSSTQVPPETDEDEFEETMSVTENLGVAMPDDGSCCRCGAAPRNASGLCATCVDADAERAGEVQSQALWRQALDAEQVLENSKTPLADANTNPPLSDLSSLRKGAEDRIFEAISDSSTADFYDISQDGLRNLAMLAAKAALVSGSREDGDV